IDIEYGSIDYTRNRIIGINIETKEPILEEIPTFISDEEKRIQELENQLLIAENEKVGGIL
ncbi:putative phage protein, partial [Clostridioides difficile CD69]